MDTRYRVYQCSAPGEIEDGKVIAVLDDRTKAERAARRVSAPVIVLCGSRHTVGSHVIYRRDRE